MTTLADVERAVARRVGPYFAAVHDASRGGTARAAYFPELQSGVSMGEPENLWLLRRGVKQDDTPIVVGPQDRQRLVQAYDSNAGTIIVERNWQQPTQPGEVCEFHHLNPMTELRPAVQAGLRRCFALDKVVLAGNEGEMDVTAQAPWITGPRQIQALFYTYPLGSTAYTNIPFKAYSRSGHVIISAGGYLLNGAVITARRPADTFVNGVTGTPTQDSDELAVDLDYGAAAGHIEAWHTIPERLFTAAAGGRQATQQMAAVEMTRQTQIWMPYSPGSFGFDVPFSLGGLSSVAR